MLSTLDMASGAGGPKLMAHRVDRFKGARQVTVLSTCMLTCFRDDIELRGATPRSSRWMHRDGKVLAGASTALERQLYRSRAPREHACQRVYLARALSRSLARFGALSGALLYSLVSSLGSWRPSISSKSIRAKENFVGTHGWSVRAFRQQSSSWLCAKFASSSPISMANGEKETEKGNRKKLTC